MSHNNVFRFAVGSKNGPKSSVWNVSWTNADLYLMIRDLMGDRKISLHKSGQRQYAFLDDKKASTARQVSGFPSQTRRISKWQQPSADVKPGIVHELSIIIPTDDLSTVNLWPNGKNLTEIHPARSGMATEICICMPRQTGSQASIPNCHQLGPGCLTYQYIAIENDLQRSIVDFRKMIRDFVKNMEIQSPDAYRVISEPVPYEADNGTSPRVIYELSVEASLRNGV